VLQSRFSVDVRPPDRLPADPYDVVPVLGGVGRRVHPALSATAAAAVAVRGVSIGGGGAVLVVFD